MYIKHIQKASMEKFLVVHLIHHVIGYIVQHIKRTQQAQHCTDGFAKYASCCGLIFVNKGHMHKIHEIFMHLENFYEYDICFIFICQA